MIKMLNINSGETILRSNFYTLYKKGEYIPNMNDKFQILKSAVIKRVEKYNSTIEEDKTKLQQLKRQNLHPDIIYSKFIRNSNTINQLSERIKTNERCIKVWKEVLNMIEGIERSDTD